MLPIRHQPSWTGTARWPVHHLLRAFSLLARLVLTAARVGPRVPGRAWVRGTLPAWLCTAALCGCASLPDCRAPAHMAARGDPAGTPLAALAAATTPPDKRGLSGLRLLTDGQDALETRLALIRRAQRSIELQYYQFTPDSTGLGLLRELRDAASRGVQVRLLIDDLYAAGADALLSGLASHANIEVRLFNPLPVRNAGVAMRVAWSLHELPRINRRMHNKLLIADGSFAVAGGRNIADDYFGQNGSVTFIDVDALVTGPAVVELGEVFDQFWSSPHAVSVLCLVGHDVDPERSRASFDRWVAGPRKGTGLTALPAGPLAGLDDPLGRRNGEQHFAQVTVLADEPSMIDDVRAERDEGDVMKGVLALMRAAQSEILLASPYLVPGKHAMEAMREAVLRGVQVQVLTNSLSTTDEPLAHFGYARYRLAMLEMGIRLHELMASVQADRQPVGIVQGSLARLHAKLAVIDRRWLVVGSMNMDRRSARVNTELALVIDSPDLADEAASLLHRDRLPVSYALRLDPASRKIEWIPGADRLRAHAFTDEPEAQALTSIARRLILLLVGEEML